MFHVKRYPAPLDGVHVGLLARAVTLDDSGDVVVLVLFGVISHNTQRKKHTDHDTGVTLTVPLDVRVDVADKLVGADVVHCSPPSYPCGDYYLRPACLPFGLCSLAAIHILPESRRVRVENFAFTASS